MADSDGEESAQDSEKDKTAKNEDGEPTILAAMNKGERPAHAGPTLSPPINMEMSPVRRPELSTGALQLSPLRSSPLRGNAGVMGIEGAKTVESCCKGRDVRVSPRNKR